MDKTVWSKLAEPMPAEFHRALPQVIYGDKARAAWYVDSRAVAEKLDEVVGQENWEFHWEAIDGVPATDAVKGFLRIRVANEGKFTDWVEKCDVGYRNASAGGKDKEAEPIKSAVSDAFKRCGVLWGIGRYLYRMEEKWYPYDSNKRRWVSAPKWADVAKTIKSTPVILDDEDGVETPSTVGAVVIKAPPKVVPPAAAKPAPAKPADPSENRAKLQGGIARASAYPEIDTSKYIVDENVPDSKVVELLGALVNELTAYEVINDKDKDWVAWLDARGKAEALKITVPPANAFKVPMARATVVKATASVLSAIEDKEKESAD